MNFVFGFTTRKLLVILNLSYRRMNVYTSKTNVMTGNIEWIIQSENYDYEQEIARSSYGDMLYDTERNQKYSLGLQKAIELMHNKGNEANVLDIGTGTGLLSMMACQHGANSVVACEAFRPMARCAEEIIKKNGFQNRIKVINKRSTDLMVGPGFDLEKKANILVTEVFDTELIGEGAIETFTHAHNYLLESDCIVVPNKARIYCQIVDSDFIGLHRNILPFYVNEFSLNLPENIKKCPGTISLHDIQLESLKNDFKSIIDPVDVFMFDFSGKTELKTEQKNNKIVFAKTIGKISGVFVWWEIEMFDDIIISCAPSWARLENLQWRDHWMQAIYYSQEIIKVEKGEKIFLHSHHDQFSLWFSVSKNINSSIKQPLCICGSHNGYSRSRIGLLNDYERNTKYLNSMKKILMENSVCLSISDGSILPLAAAKICENGFVHVIEKQQVLRNVIRDYAIENNIADRIIFYDSVSDFFDNCKYKIDVVISEPYFIEASLPWENLYYWYSMNKIKDKLNSDYKVLVKQLSLYGIAVNFKNLHKLRWPIFECENFDLSPFGRLIENAIKKVDYVIEPHSVWEYESFPVCKPFQILSLNLIDEIREDSLINLNGREDIIDDKNFNGVVLWMDYILDDGSVINNGLIENPIPGYALNWYKNLNQAVFFVPPNKENITNKQIISWNCQLDIKIGKFKFFSKMNND